MSELRDQHKAFAEWFLQQNPVAPNAEDLAWAAWKAALAQPETEAGVSWDGHNVRGDADSIAEVRRLIEFEDARQGTKPATGEDIRIYDAIAANYVNAQPETEPEPVAWQVRWIDPEEGPGAWRFCLDPSEADYYANREDHDWRPIYAHPPRDEWRLASEPPEDGRDVVVWMNDGGHGCFAIGHCLRGEWSPNYLGSPVTHWRDVTPPTESPIAAKCQRIEGSGEICGLTPPCPDCGSSLIDVADGSL